uniref:Leucine rich repeat containing 71 n=1 Tax=Gallus gallus TaxID=9031 RepID=A0A8V1AAK1_CHICK
MEKELRAEQAAGKAWIGEMGGGGAEGIPPHSPPSFSEQYQCCGLLQQDLTELCARAGIISIPRVTVRPFPAGRFGSSATASPAAEGAEPHRLGEHCIQVELQNDDPRSVCGVFLRGWKVEEEMLGVLSKCLPALGNLKTLNLWSTGLTDCMLPALGTMVASCSQSLTLEGNPLPENSFHVLMGASSTLSHLSLRNNCIDDTAAQLLGQGLSTMSSSNHSLLSLVLSFNCISDVGAGHIAEGLRWNRSLLSLSLAHNRIGDIGAQKLAEVLQPFKLRHEEVVERRRLLMEAQGQHCIRPSPPTHCWSQACTAMAMSSCLGTGCCSTSTWPVSAGLGGPGCSMAPSPWPCSPYPLLQTTASRSGAWARCWPRWRGSSSRREPGGSRGCAASRCM